MGEVRDFRTGSELAGPADLQRLPSVISPAQADRAGFSFSPVLLNIMGFS